ncbi:MAG: hypothetical protein SVC26_09800, partial [Pseudomonadota bacterium]|nr:hypothetical protein [Pseudomonadota bacterium]
MSEIEWECLSAEDGKQIAELDRFLDVVSRLSYWQCWDESTLSWRNCVKPSGRQVAKNPDKFRRRKDTPNWIAEKYEAGHELTYLETVHYYILNGNSMRGLEVDCFSGDTWQ